MTQSNSRVSIELSDKDHRILSLTAAMKGKSADAILSALIRQAGDKALRGPKKLAPVPKSSVIYPGAFKPRKAIVPALVLFAALALPTPSEAHMAQSGWEYDSECCSDRDCKEINSNEVSIRPDGYHVRGHIFPYQDRKTRPSQDGFYHYCENTHGTPLCLYVPFGGV